MYAAAVELGKRQKAEIDRASGGSGEPEEISKEEFLRQKRGGQ